MTEAEQTQRMFEGIKKATVPEYSDAEYFLAFVLTVLKGCEEDHPGHTLEEYLDFCFPQMGAEWRTHMAQNLEQLNYLDADRRLNARAKEMDITALLLP